MSRALGASRRWKFIHSVCALVSTSAAGRRPRAALLAGARQLRGWCCASPPAARMRRGLRPTCARAIWSPARRRPPSSRRRRHLAELSAAVRELVLERRALAVYVRRERRSMTKIRALPAPLRRQVERGRAAEDERALSLRERGGHVHARRPRHARPRRRRLGPPSFTTPPRPRRGRRQPPADDEHLSRFDGKRKGRRFRAPLPGGADDAGDGGDGARRRRADDGAARCRSIAVAAEPAASASPRCTTSRRRRSG